MTNLWLPKSADRATVKIGAVTFWAEDGAVCISRDVDGAEDYKTLSAAEARIRRNAIIEFAKGTVSAGSPNEQQKNVLADFVDGLDRVIKKAEEQGPYEDLSSRRDRMRRRATSISIRTKPPSK